MRPLLVLLPVRLGWCLAGLAALPLAGAAEPQPRAHAHNDYEHPRPLLDALDQGFCSVEADVYLVEGRLLVAHDRDKVSAERTLQGLYLEPLRQRVQRHGGRVFQGGPMEFTLLVDIKSDAEPAYRELERLLPAYHGMLTRFEQGSVRPGAVTVILSGNRPLAVVAAQSARWVGIDGRLPDLEGNPSRSLMPLVSDHWGRHFQWKGTGTFPVEERQRLESWVKRAHAQGRRLRFWAVPDLPAAWGELHKAGVDLINTDDLEGLGGFLRGLGRADAP